MTSRNTPHLFPGPLHQSNRRARHWSWQNLVAFGSHSYIVVVDPTTLRLFQTLDEHKGIVTEVKWAPRNLSFLESKPGRIQETPLHIVSADSLGQLLVWNVLEARPCRSRNEENVGVLQLEWITSKSPYHLAVLHGNGILLLWDTQNDSIIWKKDFNQEEISFFAVNPFIANHAILASRAGWIFISSGLNPEVAPEIQLKFRISGASAPAVSQSKTKSASAPKQSDVLHKEILIFDLSVHLKSN